MAAKKGNGTHRTLRVYKAYNFRDKDPVIDSLRTIIEDHFNERVRHKHLRQIEEAGGPTAGCLARQFFGETLRPQNATVEAAGRSIGFERRWVPMKAKQGRKTAKKSS